MRNPEPAISQDAAGQARPSAQAGMSRVPEIRSCHGEVQSISHVPELLEIAVQVTVVAGSYTLRKETPASHPSRMTVSPCLPSQKPGP
jgi:hypothetical protein